MSMNVGPITNTIIEKCLEHLKKEETKEKISSNIICPIMDDVLTRIYPYVAILSALLLIIIILLIILIYLMAMAKK